MLNLYLFPGKQEHSVSSGLLEEDVHIWQASVFWSESQLHATSWWIIPYLVEKDVGKASRIEKNCLKKIVSLKKPQQTTNLDL